MMGRRSYQSVLISILLYGLVLASGSLHAEDGIFASTLLPYDYHVHTLENGLRVVLVPTEDRELISLQIGVKTGSRNEVEAGKSGFAHFFEHMMFRGSENFSASEYGNILSRLGADQNAYTSDDYTNYHITFPASGLAQIMEVEADRFARLRYSEEEFRTEALAVKGEYLKNFSSPLQKLHERLREKAFKDHPYQHTTMGFFRDIEAMPDQFDYSREFYRRWYRPDNTVLILVGAIDTDTALKEVKRHWQDWAPGAASIDVPAQQTPQGPIHDHIAWEAPTQPWLSIAFHAPAHDPNSTELPALQLLFRHLFGKDSDLHQQLLVREQRLDRLIIRTPARIDPYLVTVHARLNDSKDLAYVRDRILQAVAQARVHPIADTRLEQLRRGLINARMTEMDSSAAIGAQLAAFAHFDRDPRRMDRYYADLERLDATVLRETAERYLTDANRVVISLSNEAEEPSLQQRFALDTEVKALRAKRGNGAYRLTEMTGAGNIVDLQLVFLTGSAQDPVDNKGLAALTQQVLMKGGSRYHGRSELDRALAQLGAKLEAVTDKEMTSFNLSAHRGQFAAAYALLMERLLHPAWNQDDFDYVRAQQINALQTDLRGNNDEELAKEVLYQVLYGPSHAYGFPNLGLIDDLRGIRIDDVRRHYQHQYSLDRLHVGIAGPYPRELSAWLARDLAVLPLQGQTQTRIPAAPVISGRHATIVEKQTPATAVSIGFPISIQRGDPDWIALWLARAWLGEHRSFMGRLFQKLRKDRGLNYGNYAYIEYFPEGMFRFYPQVHLARSQQIFQIWLRPLRSIGDAHFATRAALFELQQLIDQGLNQNEFERMRDYLHNYVAVLTQSQSRRLGYALDSDFYGIEDFKNYVRKSLKDLTLEQVNRALRRHLQTRDLHIVMISRDAEQLAIQLAADVETPLQYNAEVGPVIEAEDHIIAPLSLGLDVTRIGTVPVAEVFKNANALNPMRDSSAQP